MNPHIIFVVIVAQVVVFQFLATRWIRAMLSFRLGLSDLPPQAARSLADHNRRAAHVWPILGGLLLLAAVGLALLPGLPYAQRKIGLALVSLASSAGLVVQMLIERGALRAIAAQVPPPAVRSASLAPRRLEQYYSPSLETLPTLVLCVTVAFTILAMRRLLPGLPPGFEAVRDAAELWFAPLAQLVFVIGGMLAARGLLHGGALLSQHSRASLGDPAAALRIEDALRRVKLRGLLAVRIAIVVMFGLMQVRRVCAPLDSGGWLAGAVWGLVAVMLGLFAGLMLRAAALRKSSLP